MGKADLGNVAGQKMRFPVRGEEVKRTLALELFGVHGNPQLAVRGGERFGRFEAG